MHVYRVRIAATTFAPHGFMPAVIVVTNATDGRSIGNLVAKAVKEDPILVDSARRGDIQVQEIDITKEGVF